MKGLSTPREPAPRSGIRWNRALPLVPGCIAAVVCAFGLAYGSRAAGGADPFGYVSQAYLWLKGDLQLEQPLSREFPWPHSEETLSPLGYRPGEIRHTIVPTYAPGVPLLMAAFDTFFGSCGPYIVSPVFAALLVLATFVLAYRLTGDRAIGVVTTMLMAGSPAFLFNLMFPMSDIVAASLWTTALALLTWPGVGAAGVAGCAAGAAVLARPNLVPLALPLAIGAATWPPGTATERPVARAVAFSIGVVAGAVVVAGVNRSLYGSPFASGYGDASILYSLTYLKVNALRYSVWLLQSESWLVALAILPIILRQVRPTQCPSCSIFLLALFAGLVTASYLFYLPFEDWWFLRFLLPAFPILFLFETLTLIWIVRRMRGPLQPVALAAIVMVAILYRGWFVSSRGLMRIGNDEQRYIAVSQYIDRALPSNAVILSMQHSGSIRYYSGRLTLRYDLLSPTRLPFVIDWFSARGYRPYILLDDSEEPEYRHRFGTDSAAGRLEMRVLAEMTSPVKVRLYDPLPDRGTSPPPDPIVLRPSRGCVAPGGPWAR